MDSVIVCYLRIDFFQVITPSVLFHVSYGVGPKVSFSKTPFERPLSHRNYILIFTYNAI